MTLVTVVTTNKSTRGIASWEMMRALAVRHCEIQARILQCVLLYYQKLILGIGHKGTEAPLLLRIVPLFLFVHILNAIRGHL